MSVDNDRSSVEKPVLAKFPQPSTEFERGIRGKCGRLFQKSARKISPAPELLVVGERLRQP
jgi:hypothetical protein